MTTTAERASRGVTATVHYLAGALLLQFTVLASLGLSARHLARGFDSDVLYPLAFVNDVLEGSQSLAGWTFSSAPCWFPDLFLFGLLRASGLEPGTAFAVYSALYFLLFAGAASWLLRCRGWGKPEAFSAGATLTAGLVGSGYWLGHYKFLSWLCLPISHGGSVLAGMVLLALGAGIFSRGLARAPITAFVFATSLALLSDSLVLFHFLLPLLAGVWLSEREARARPCPSGNSHASESLSASGRLMAGMALGALFLALFVRLTLHNAEVFHFSKVFRYAPVPSAVWASVSQWFRDFSERMLWEAPLVPLCALAAAVFHAVCRRPEQPGWWRRFVILSLAATFVLPLLSCYWRNYEHGRYLLPWITLAPLSLLALARQVWRPWIPIAGAGAMLLLVVFGGASLPPALALKPTPDDSKLADFTRQRGLSDGLAEYWQCHRFNVSANAPSRLLTVKSDGSARFWNNNSEWYIRRDSEGTPVARKIDFVIVNGLEEAQVEKRFGFPSEIVQVGGRTLWLYDAQRGNVLGKEILKDHRLQRP